MTFQAPPEERSYKDTPQATLADLKAEMADFGLQFEGPPEADGEIHRVPSSLNKKDKAGWYVVAALDNGLIFANYGDWRIGEKSKWSSRLESTYSAEDRFALEKHQAKVKAERKRVHAEAAQDARSMWSDAFPGADNHPYLALKQIQAHGTKIAGDDRLIVPVYIDGEISSLQYIDAKGRKLFYPGGKTRGGYYLIPGAEPAVVCEGFATAATIHEATRKAVYCAFTASNLEKVVAVVKSNHQRIIIAGDDDKWTPGNPGRTAADAAARKHGCGVLFPTFSDESTKPTDFNDMARIDGLSAVSAAGAATVRRLDPRVERLRPLTLEELKSLQPRRMLVKGLLGAGEMSVWFGEPKCGKSFLVTNLALAISTGQEWCGKKVKQVPVIYIAAEGAGGFAKRIEAHRRHHGGIDDAKFYPILTGVNLLDPDADLGPILHWVEEFDAGLVIVDTLARTMAGGNENSPEDMGIYIANCDKIREMTGAHVSVVHHSPKHNNNTPRGHSSLFGAVDALIRVEKRETGHAAKVEASKDDEDGLEIGFSLKVIEVGVDEDGSTVTSCAVITDVEAPAKKEKRLTGDTLRAMEALIDVVNRDGRPITNHSGIPDGTYCVAVEIWRQEFYSVKPGSSEAKQKAFKRAMDRLNELRKANHRDGLVWPAWKSSD
jgi:putative DNA primase/helicase